MTKKKKWIIAGAVVLVVLVAGFFILRRVLPSLNSAAVQDQLETVTLERGPLTTMIGATGSLRPAQSAVIAWQASGEVGEINVALGQEVEDGQVLAELAPDSLSQSILQAQIDVINAQKALDALYEPDELLIAQAEQEVEQAQKSLDDLLNPTPLAIAQADKSVLDAQEMVDDAQYDVDALARGRGSDEQIALAQADYLLAQDNLEIVQSQYDKVPGDPTLDPRKALALTRLEDAKTKRDRALASLNWYLGEPSEQEVAEKMNSLALALAQLGESQQHLADLRNPTPPAIALAQARLDEAQANLADLKDGPSEDDVTIAQTRLTQAKSSLKQGYLEAPFDGTLTDIQIMQGDLVSPGKTAFRVDDLSSYYVDLLVSEVDIQQVQVGQPVSITFDAILDREYSGEVVEIGQFGQSNQGVVSFPVTVELTDPDQLVKPGMTAVANVITSLVQDVLQLPNRAIQDEDGKKFVYVMGPEGLRTVYVQIGLSSDTASEIISSELIEGDEILVNMPDDFPAFGPRRMMSSGGAAVDETQR
jgi:HlyD family secretion protein